jgi:hypothetical protein
MEQLDKRSLDIIVDDGLDEIRRPYLTKINKMLNWGKTVFKDP